MKEGLFNFEPMGLDHTTQNDPTGNAEMIRTVYTALADTQSLADRAAPSFTSLAVPWRPDCQCRRFGDGTTTLWV